MRSTGSDASLWMPSIQGSTRTTDNHLARTHEELSGIAFTLDEIRKHLVEGPYKPPEPP